MRSIVLAGFMGAGKSTVGAALAEKLGLPFIDTDAEIGRAEGMSIPEIFARHGEAHFRARERALAEQLVLRERCVIATGGGMIASDEIRALLLANCLCIGLIAAPETILARVGGESAAQSRPMLAGPDVRARIASLLNARAPFYRALHFHLHTDEVAPELLAERIAELSASEQLRIPVAIPGEQPYDIVIGDGLLAHLGAFIAGRGWTAPALIASDAIVASYHAGTAQLALARESIPSRIHTMDAGERNKTLNTVASFYRAMSEAGMDRNSPLVALGGGVVGDTAGFAAATYMRGVPFVQAPTSLLAMADSSIGGKTGVDTDFGKNLVGAFKQPDLVVMDTRMLGSLPVIELRCGYAEIIKCAFISGGQAFDRARMLAQSPLGMADASSLGEDGWVDDLMMQTLVDAILLKREVVVEDPFERGRRSLLNFGHTFGHGIEAWSGLRLKHGYAVALGMVCAARASRALGLCEQAHVDALIAMLRGVGLPTRLADVRPFGIGALDVDAIWRAMQNDKKKRAGQLRFVLMRAPGDLFLSDALDADDARTAIASLNE
jgi:3-dehydroquinate synthase